MFACLNSKHPLRFLGYYVIKSRNAYFLQTLTNTMRIITSDPPVLQLVFKLLTNLWSI